MYVGDDSDQKIVEIIRQNAVDWKRKIETSGNVIGAKSKFRFENGHGGSTVGIAAVKWYYQPIRRPYSRAVKTDKNTGRRSFGGSVSPPATARWQRETGQRSIDRRKRWRAGNVASSFHHHGPVKTGRLGEWLRGGERERERLFCEWERARQSERDRWTDGVLLTNYRY